MSMAELARKAAAIVMMTGLQELVTARNWLFQHVPSLQFRSSRAGPPEVAALATSWIVSVLFRG